MAFSLVLSTPTLAAKPLLVKVETSILVHSAGTRYAKVVVTALDDIVKVQNIDVNRGNCRIDNYKSPFSTKETISPPPVALWSVCQ